MGSSRYRPRRGIRANNLLINGEKVVEIDYHAMHPHLLYYWENEQCPDDFYEKVMSQCECSRFIAKSVVLAAVNASTYAKMTSGINLNKAKETKANRYRAKPKPILYDELKKSGLTPTEVVDAIKAGHPMLAKYIYSGSANKLMLEESEIMTSVLFRLMKNNVPALPIDDSVLVPARFEEVTRQAMTGCYHERTGFRINLKIQSPPQ